MFERFTRDAREAVTQAQAEARALGSETIDARHLLLGVAAAGGRGGETLDAHGATADALRERLRPPDDGAALASLGIDLDEVRRRADASFGPGALDRAGGPRRRRRGGGHVPFTPAAKKALELALREALRLGDNRIGSEHVLLGLLRDDDAGAAALLRSAGADPKQVRAALSPAGSRRGRGG